jgi:hypothetical protein
VKVPSTFGKERDKVTETATVTPAQQAAQAVADPQNPQDFWKHNVEQVLKAVVGLVPFRHEGEASRIIVALDNLHEDIQDVLSRAEPLAPTVGQPDPVLQALIAKQNRTEDMLQQALDALANMGANVSTTSETVTAPVSDAAPVVDPTPVTAAANAPVGAPPGWTWDSSTNQWVQVVTDSTANATTDSTAITGGTAA